MTSLRVGVDLDGVVFDFVDSLRRHLTATLGRPAETMPDASTWDFYADDWGLTLEEFLAHCHEAANAGVLFTTGAPYPGVVDGLQSLLDAGHSVHLVTDRAGFGAPGVAQAQTQAWLADNRVPFTSLTLTSDKTSVPTDVFIEDRPKFFTELTAAGVPTFLRSHRYNESVDCPPDRRVRDFSAFTRAVLARRHEPRGR
jgi:phosphoglycolate phosphatase-like HAD superfamily hydrolase